MRPFVPLPLAHRRQAKRGARRAPLPLAAAAALSAGRGALLGRRATVSSFRQREEKREQRRRWLEGLERRTEEPEAANVVRIQ